MNNLKSVLILISCMAASLVGGCVTAPRFEEPSISEPHAVLSMTAKDEQNGIYVVWASEIQGLPAKCREQCRVPTGEVAIFVETRISKHSFWSLNPKKETDVSYGLLKFTAIEGQTYQISAEKGSLVGHIAFVVRDTNGNTLATVEEHKHTKQHKQMYFPVIIPAK